MNRIANPMLMLIPEELTGVLLMGLLVAAGLAMMIGARRTGGALFVAAIAIPLVTAIIEALMNDVFALLPDALQMPVAFAITLAIWLAVAWMLVTIVFGQRVVDKAKGHLLADGIKGVLGFLYRRPVAVMVSVSILYFAWGEQ